VNVGGGCGGDRPTAAVVASGAAVGTRARCYIGIKINSHRGVPICIIIIIILLCLLFMFMSFTAESTCRCVQVLGNIGSKSHLLLMPPLAERNCTYIILYYIILPLRLYLLSGTIIILIIIIIYRSYYYYVRR